MMSRRGSDEAQPSHSNQMWTSMQDFVERLQYLFTSYPPSVSGSGNTWITRDVSISVVDITSNSESTLSDLDSCDTGVGGCRLANFGPVFSKMEKASIAMASPGSSRVPKTKVYCSANDYNTSDVETVASSADGNTTSRHDKSLTSEDGGQPSMESTVSLNTCSQEKSPVRQRQPPFITNQTVKRPVEHRFRIIKEINEVHESPSVTRNVFRMVVAPCKTLDTLTIDEVEQEKQSPRPKIMRKIGGLRNRIRKKFWKRDKAELPNNNFDSMLDLTRSHSPPRTASPTLTFSSRGGTDETNSILQTHSSSGQISDFNGAECCSAYPELLDDINSYKTESEICSSSSGTDATIFQPQTSSEDPGILSSSQSTGTTIYCSSVSTERDASVSQQDDGLVINNGMAAGADTSRQGIACSDRRQNNVEECNGQVEVSCVCKSKGVAVDLRNRENGLIEGFEVEASTTSVEITAIKPVHPSSKEMVPEVHKMLESNRQTCSSIYGVTTTSSVGETTVVDKPTEVYDVPNLISNEFSGGMHNEHFLSLTKKKRTQSVDLELAQYSGIQCEAGLIKNLEKSEDGVEVDLQQLSNVVWSTSVSPDFHSDVGGHPAAIGQSKIKEIASTSIDFCEEPGTLRLYHVLQTEDDAQLERERSISLYSKASKKSQCASGVLSKVKSRSWNKQQIQTQISHEISTAEQRFDPSRIILQQASLNAKRSLIENNSKSEVTANASYGNLFQAGSEAVVKVCAKTHDDQKIGEISVNDDSKSLQPLGDELKMLCTGPTVYEKDHQQGDLQTVVERRRQAPHEVKSLKLFLSETFASGIEYTESQNEGVLRLLKSKSDMGSDECESAEASFKLLAALRKLVKKLKPDTQSSLERQTSEAEAIQFVQEPPLFREIGTLTNAAPTFSPTFTQTRATANKVDDKAAITVESRDDEACQLGPGMPRNTEPIETDPLTVQVRDQYNNCLPRKQSSNVHDVTNLPVSSMPGIEALALSIENSEIAARENQFSPLFLQDKDASADFFTENWVEMKQNPFSRNLTARDNESDDALQVTQQVGRQSSTSLRDLPNEAASEHTVEADMKYSTTSPRPAQNTHPIQENEGGAHVLLMYQASQKHQDVNKTFASRDCVEVDVLAQSSQPGYQQRRNICYSNSGNGVISTALVQEAESHPLSPSLGQRLISIAVPAIRRRRRTVEKAQRSNHRGNEFIHSDKIVLLRAAQRNHTEKSPLVSGSTQIEKEFREFRELVESSNRNGLTRNSEVTSCDHQSVRTHGVESPAQGKGHHWKGWRKGFTTASNSSSLVPTVQHVQPNSINMSPSLAPEGIEVSYVVDNTMEEAKRLISPFSGLYDRARASRASHRAGHTRPSWRRVASKK